MDRQRLELLTVQAGALNSALLTTPDSNEKAKHQCLNLAAEIKSLVQAWNNLARALYDPQLKVLAPFAQILDIVLSDNAKIVNELRTSLSEVRTKQAQYDNASRSQRWSVTPIKKGHVLVSFLGRRTTALRLLQIRYSLSVLDVLLGVVLYAKILGHENDDRQAALQDQLARLQVEAEARALVFREECRIGDKFIISSMWLKSVTWQSDSFADPPFETLALQWFEIQETRMQTRKPSGTISTDDLARIVKQMQLEMRQQDRKQQEKIESHERQNEEMRTWAESTIRQLEFSQQKAAQDAAAKMEELKNQLEVQQQQIERDALTIEQLKFSRNEWSTHYQKQSDRSQKLEKAMVELQQHYTQQQERLNNLQQKYDKLQQASARLQTQNIALRAKLNETEDENHKLEKARNELQYRYDKVVQYNKQWKALHESSGNAQRNAQFDELHGNIQEFKHEIASLKADLASVADNRDQLRKSLTKAEGEKETHRLRADKLQERLATRAISTAPSAYPPATSPERTRYSAGSSGSSSSRRRSRSGSRQTSSPSIRGHSRESHSRTTSSATTYVNDEEENSDQEYYEQKLPRRISGNTGSDGGYKISSIFSLRPRQRSVMA